MSPNSYEFSFVTVVVIVVVVVVTSITGGVNWLVVTPTIVITPSGGTCSYCVMQTFLIIYVKEHHLQQELQIKNNTQHNLITVENCISFKLNMIFEDTDKRWTLMY